VVHLATPVSPRCSVNTWSTVANFGAMIARCASICASSPSGDFRNRTCRSWLTLSLPIVRLPMRLRYHATLSFDDANSETPAPASVIFEVDPKTNGRFGWPCFAHATMMLGISMRDSVRWWTAYALSQNSRKSDAAVRIEASRSTTASENTVPVGLLYFGMH